jgi:hypothetical protein
MILGSITLIAVRGIIRKTGGVKKYHTVMVTPALDGGANSRVLLSD